MNQDLPENKSAPIAESAPGQTNDTRRKLVRGGLAGAPLLMALKSTPVLAGNCKLPSGFSVSGNQSQIKAGIATCQQAPGVTYWKANCPDTSKTFVSIFTTGPKNTSVTTLASALNLGGIEARFAAAYFNLITNQFSTTSPFSLTELVKMWDLGVKGSTGYTATTGVTWRQPEIENYFNYLMTA